LKRTQKNRKRGGKRGDPHTKRSGGKISCNSPLGENEINKKKGQGEKREKMDPGALLNKRDLSPKK